MKTIKNQLGTLIFCITIIFSADAYSQKDAKNLNPFIRVYSIEGKKIAKGHMVFINDSILGLKNGDKLIELGIDELGRIKTKKSSGNNILIGSATGATIGVILGVSTADPDSFLGYTAGEGALAFGGLGAVGGAAIGGITSAFKNSETYIIDGDIRKWKIFKEMIEKGRVR